MTGVVAGRVSGSTLDRMADEMWTEAWYGDARFETGPFGIELVHHGSKDPAGRTTWSDGRRAGVVHGAVTNLDALGLSAGDLFDRVLDRPNEILPALNGSFLIVGFDAAADRLVVATDKLGTRLCHYLDDGTPALSSTVAALLPLVDDPTVDRQGVSDVLLMSHAWGEKTLVEEIRTLPPGSVFVHENSQPTVESYHEHFFQPAEPGAEYVSELVERYRDVIAEMADSMEGTVGLWLSGGLDSRAMAAALDRYHDSLRTYTYDGNPAGGGNPEIAQRVADRLGIRNDTVDLNPDDFLDRFDAGVRITDGMVGWKTFLNVSAGFTIEDDLDVLLEASGQGGLLGYDVWRPYLEQSSSPADALYRSDHMVDRDLVTALLDAEVDPMNSYREEVAKSTADTYTGQVLDTYYRNFYPRGDFASNQVTRSVAGTRVPFAHGEFLDHVTSMPEQYRARAVPLTGGKIPYGTAPLKLELARALGRGVESIPYERTKVSPDRPLWQHSAGFVVSKSIQRLRRQTTYGGKSMSGEWYRHHSQFQERIDSLIDAACDRPFFDDGTIRDIQRDHLSGDRNYPGPISGVTTVERWLQLVLD